MVTRRIALLCAVALLAGCADRSADRAAATASADSGTQTQTPPSTGPKACDLLTREDITRVTGLAVKPGTTTNDYMGVSQCRFDRETGSEGGVMVSLHEHGEILNYQKVPGSEAVAALGDAAVWNAQTAQLAVRKGEAVLSISFLFSPAQQQWATELARTALQRLGATDAR